MHHQNHIKRLIKNHHRRLQVLKEQQALHGLDTPPGILLEIEDIETTIAEAELELQIAEQSKKDVPHKIYHNLPQRPQGFVGRTTELEKIIALLQPYPDSQHSVVTIRGIGGIGKTALALETAHWIWEKQRDAPYEDQKFDAIIWASGKREMLIDEIIPRHQVISTLNEIYSTIALVLERDDITYSPSDKQEKIVQNVLAQRRTLLIIDNLETIDDKKVISFLQELPAPTKAIVTTRHNINTSYPIELTKMPQDEALQIIEEQCIYKDVKLTDRGKKILCKRTDGIPLAIIWSVSQIARGSRIDIVLDRLKNPKEDLAQFCFKEIVDNIRNKNYNAYRLLLALSLFADGATRDTLGYMIDVDESSLKDIYERDISLANLEELSLVNRNSDRFEMLALTRTYANAQLIKDSNLEIELRYRWINYFNNLFLLNYKLSFKRLDLEHRNIADVIEWCWENGHISDFIKFVDQFTSFLWARGYWAESEELLNKALENTAELKQLEKPKAKLDVHLAYALSVNGKLKEAENACQRALSILKNFDDIDAQVGALSVLGHIYTQQNNLHDAEKVLRQGLEIADINTVQDKTLRARILRNLGQLYSLREDFDKAMIYFNEALEVFEKYKIENDQYSYTYRLAGLTAMKQGQRRFAKNLLYMSLKIAEELKVPIDINRAAHELAKLEAFDGDKEKALKLATQAMNGHMRLRDAAGFDEMRVLIDTLKQ